MICAACHLETAAMPCEACGGSPLLVSPAGSYRLMSVLGQGGAGVTYRASRVGESAATLPDVCVKELSYRRMQDLKSEELFSREAQVLRELDDPAVPRYVDDFVAGTGRARCLYIVQEFVDGQDLGAELASERHSEREIIAIADELLQILERLEQLRPPVVHRDIKPHNVMRRASDGKLLLVDFGSVKEAVSDGDAGSTVAGTFGYMAPEQQWGKATGQSDLYAVGVMTAVLLARREPGDMLDADHRLDLDAHVRASPGLVAWLKAMTATRPSERPATARAARAMLTSKTRTEAQKPPAAARARAPKKAGNGSRLAWVIAGLALLGVGGWLGLSEPGPGPDASEARRSEAAQVSSEPPKPAPMVVEEAGWERGGAVPLDGFPAPSGPVDASSSKPGPVLLATSSGLYAFGDEGAERVDDTPLRDAKHVVVAKDATYILLGDAVLKRVGSKMHRLSPDHEKSRGFSQLAVGPSGELWVLGLFGLSHFDGTNWGFRPKSDFFKHQESALLNGVAIDATGHVVVTGYRGIAVYAGDHWRDYQVDELLGPVAVHPEGHFVSRNSSNKLVRFDDSGLVRTHIHHERLSFFRASVVIGADGRLLGRDGSSLVVFDADGARRHAAGLPPASGSRAAGAAGAPGTAAVIDGALDASGRAWVATSVGLVLVSEGGDSTLWPSASSVGLASDVKALAVVGMGPENPPPPQEARSGSVQGSVTFRRQPLAGARLEACVDAAVVLRDGATSPCDKAPWKAQVVTDAEGRFTLSDVPARDLELVVRTPSDRWHMVYYECCSQLQGAPKVTLEPIHAW